MVIHKSPVSVLLRAVVSSALFGSICADAAVPAAPPTICIDSNCVTSPTPDIPSSGAIRFHPGHYVDYDGILYLDGNLQSKKAGALAVLDEIANESTVQGVQIALTWAVLEGAKAGDYSAGFALVDELVARAKLRNKKLLLSAINYQIGYFHAPGTISFPAYLMTSAYGPVQSITSSAAYRVGGVVAVPGGVESNLGANGQIASAIWEAPVMDRLIALTQAYGARYKNNPYIEIWSPLTNMAFPGVYNNFGFSSSASSTQVQRMIKAARAAWPNTGLRLWIDYFGTDANTKTVIDAAVAADWIVGGNDVLPKEDVQADRIFNGETFGTDHRGVVPWVSQVAHPELCGKEGTFTPSQLYNHAMQGNLSAGMRPMRPQYFIWIRNTWNCSEGGPQRWSTGILPFIRSINGSVVSGLDSTLTTALSLKSSYCPKGYSDGCQ